MWLLFIFFVSYSAQVPTDWQKRYYEGTLLFSPTKVDGSIGATIGNGFLATTVNSDTLYISGVYNGYNNTTPSHRARIPGFSSIDFSARGEVVVGFALDLETATYHKRSLIGSSFVESTTYAHRSRRNVFVYELCLVNSTYTTKIDLNVNEGSNSGDISAVDTYNITSFPKTIVGRKFSTLLAESYLTNVSDISVVSDFVPNSVILDKSSPCQSFIFVYAVSLEGANEAKKALSEYYAAKNVTSEQLLDEHKQAWSDLGPTKRITLETCNVELKQTIFSSLYYLLSSIRSDWHYSLSPGGLASNGYNGHVFWDCETWMVRFFFSSSPSYFVPLQVSNIASVLSRYRKICA